MRRSLLLFSAVWLAAAAGAREPAPYTGVLTLVRYDSPIGLSDGFAPTRQPAVRQTGEEAIDWPEMRLNGKPIFQQGAEERVPLKLRAGAEAASPFQLRTDDDLEPGHHWLRAMEWRGGRRHLYTADATARTANGAETMAGRYELWTFPLRISGEGGPGVKNVELRLGGAICYRRDGPWRSLTLLLPANLPGERYELSVDGRPPVKFDIGLMPVKPGAPRDQLYALDTTVPGDGPKVRVRTLVRATTFPNPQAWADDLASLKQPVPKSSAWPRGEGMARYVGLEVPRSPFLIYAAELPAGQSGGFFHQGRGGFAGSPAAYAAHLAEAGYDAVFEAADDLPPPSDPGSLENRAQALAGRGLKLGLEYDSGAQAPAFGHPGLPLYAHALAEWHAPLYRSLSLAAQRFARLPNFLGFSVGETSCGYAADSEGAPPTPDRPWGRAMIGFLAEAQPAIPRAPLAGPPQFPYEYPAHDTAEFARYAERFDAAFREYEYFAEAVRQAGGSGMVFTTSSFGSAPGRGGRGGWPWASLPGRSIFSGLNTLQAYDFNRAHAARPLQNEALTDRLGSYWEKKPTWSLLDNYGLLYGREAWQRACALALTRGIQGLGTNFLPAGGEPLDAARAMNAWMRRLGGVYANLDPTPTIGIFYSQYQALQRPVLTEPHPPAERLEQGSQEGKVAEALFLCHAAGWPARVITYQELMRGPLPPEMRAILVVGCPQADASWSWGPGLEKPLQLFLAGGGRVITDEESTAPVEHRTTQLRLAAYQPQSNLDPTPLLFRRNAENIALLRAAMEGVPPPVAVSAEPIVWAIPGRCGAVQYLTAVNQAYAEGEEAKSPLKPADPRATRPEEWKTKANASLYVRPQTAALEWHTERPIYDLRQLRRLEPAEAGQVDFTHDAFQFYALPPAAVTAPTLQVAPGTGGFYEATVGVGAPAMAGIPVRLEIRHGDETAELFGISGSPLRLPVRRGEPMAEYRLSATELLSGLTGELSWTSPPPPALTPAVRSAVRVSDARALARFATRTTTPLTIGLTPEQARDPGYQEAARLLQEYYRHAQRAVSIAQVAPGSIVESLQPYRSPQHFPQWKTVPSDLILLGTPQSNVLLLDQARGEIFPRSWETPSGETARIFYARSPFVGECDVVDILAADLPLLSAAVKTITSPPPAPR